MPVSVDSGNKISTLPTPELMYVFGIGDTSIVHGSPMTFNVKS